MKVPVLFPKIFDYPFTYKSEISESLKPAFGSLVGVVAGSLIKFCVTLSYLFFYLNIFWTYKENFF